ncbi:MAG TPA: Xaa-Pro peptidase family protein, partial [Mycobacteriales bacterium]|nr:Xaa-Pro peptidase family protein [Mycobacteriales bacterium]
VERLAAAQKATAQAGVDTLLISPGADLRYLTGYHAMPLERLTCLVVPATGDPVLVVPQLERPAALASPAARLGIDILGWAETDDPFTLVATLARAAAGGTPARVAVANRMWAEHAAALRHALPDTEQDLAGTVMCGLRIRKSAEEIAALRRAAHAIDRVHQRMGEWLRPGRTEAQVGRDIAEAIVAEGHDATEFVIVASGPNGASPHHGVSDRMIERGDPVVVDIGGITHDGYCSDSTRTYLAGGQPDPEFARYYQVLAHAQQAGRAAVRPGVDAQSIDAAAREVIADAGYGEFFVHRTGHGIGLETHEEPYLVAGNTEPLAAGMVFSVEPGIYLPGRHGARIEDIVACTQTGVDPLNVARRDLVILEG